MHGHDTSAPRDMLRAKGLKATPRRVALISLLTHSKKPVSASEIRAAWQHGTIDTVTLYRALDALTKAGIVRRVDLQHGHTDYELNTHSHHHHLVCTDCGKIEAFDECPAEALEKLVLQRSRGFASLREHSLEFFGTCKACII